MPWCVVQKRFGGANGAQMLIGQLVEIPDGTRLSQLIEQRYVRQATAKEVESAEEVEVPEDEVPVPPPVRKRKPTVRRRR